LALLGIHKVNQNKDYSIGDEDYPMEWSHRSFLMALPVNRPEKPPVKNHFSLPVHLYSFEIHGFLPPEHIKVLAFPIFGLVDFCWYQHFLCFYLQAF
jgi:hypothetical protein